jgi:hypothetical protein
MAAQAFSEKAYPRRCSRGHMYHTDQIEARWRTAKGQVRYHCPVCWQMGVSPPKGWTKITLRSSGS